MKSEYKLIKIAEAIGRLLTASTPDKTDLERVSKCYRADNDGKSIKDKLNLRGITSSRKVREEIDREAGWQRLEYRLYNRQQLGDGRKAMAVRRAVGFGVAALGCAVVVLFVALFINKSAKNNADLYALEVLAEMKPVYSLPMLYLEDGTAVDLNAKGSEEFLADNNIEFSASENEIQYSQESSPKDVYNTIIIPAGNSFQLTLCDGTRVWLHTKSKLRYFTSNKTRERRVELEGEAFFDVAKDDNRPFIITSNDHDIEVLGTKFNVTAYPQEKITYTTLLEGHVRIVVHNPEGQVTVSLDTPGAQSVYNYTIENQSSISSRMVDTKQYTAWMNGMFQFNNASLEDVMLKLSLWYDFKYEIASHLKSSKFSGEFNRFDELRTVLDILRKTGVDFSIAIEDDRIVIR